MTHARNHRRAAPVIGALAVAIAMLLLTLSQVSAAPTLEPAQYDESHAVNLANAEHFNDCNATTSAGLTGTSGAPQIEPLPASNAEVCFRWTFYCRTRYISTHPGGGVVPIRECFFRVYPVPCPR